MRKILIAMFTGLIICCNSVPLLAQPPDSLWSRAFGYAEADVAEAVLATPDGGFVVVGTVEIPDGDLDLWMIKCDMNGDSQWSSVFSGNLSQRGYDVKPTLDGGYVIAGTTSGSNGTDFLLIRTDANGNELWRKQYGGPLPDFAEAVFQTLDGGFVIGGQAQSFGAGEGDFWIVRTNESGDSVGSRTFGGPLSDHCYAMARAGDGAFLLGGVTYSFGSGAADMWVVKVAANGDSLWSRSFGSLYGDQCHAITQTVDGNFLLCGSTQGFGAYFVDAWIVKLSASGDSLWSQRYGGEGFDHWYAALASEDGTVMLAGPQSSFGSGDYDFQLMKIAADGDSLWSRTFGGGASDLCNAVARTFDDGFVLAGQTESFGSGNSDVWVVKAGPDLIDDADDSRRLTPSIRVLQAYPNPFNSVATIRIDLPQEVSGRLVVYDGLGRIVNTLLNGNLTAGSHDLRFDANGLSSGTYLLRWESPVYSATRKAILIR